MKELMKKHADTVVVIGGILTSFLWMNHQFNDVGDKFVKLTLEMNSKFAAVDLKIAAIESDIRNINTILICKDVMPKGLALDTKQGE